MEPDAWPQKKTFGIHLLWQTYTFFYCLSSVLTAFVITSQSLTSLLWSVIYYQSNRRSRISWSPQFGVDILVFLGINRGKCLGDGLHIHHAIKMSHSRFTQQPYKGGIKVITPLLQPNEVGQRHNDLDTLPILPSWLLNKMLRCIKGVIICLGFNIQCIPQWKRDNKNSLSHIVSTAKLNNSNTLAIMDKSTA